MTPPAFVPAGQGHELHAFGDTVTFLITGTMTGGKYTSFIETTPPGGGPPPHRHEREDELFFVMEGRVAFLIDGEWTEAGPGAAVYAPISSVHTFRNVGELACRMLVTVSPSGFEDFFAEAAAEFAKPGGPDMARAIGIANAYGISFVEA